MKKVFLLSTFLAGSLLFYKPAEAQFRIHVNINPVAAWGNYDLYRHNHSEVIYDHRHWNDSYRDHRDWDDRDWRQNHDRYDDRGYDNRRGDDHYGHDKHERDNNQEDRDRRHDYEHRYNDNRRGRW